MASADGGGAGLPPRAPPTNALAVVPSTTTGALATTTANQHTDGGSIDDYERRLREAHEHERKLRAIVDSAPPPKLRNVAGSAAGASSGEFHTYRQIRRDEQDRMRRLEAADMAAQRAEEHRRKVEALAREDEARLAKRRGKRQKRKEKERAARERQKRKNKGADGGGSGGDGGGDSSDEDEEADEARKKQRGGSGDGGGGGGGGDGDGDVSKPAPPVLDLD
jgi:hypothetical protein